MTMARTCRCLRSAGVSDVEWASSGSSVTAAAAGGVKLVTKEVGMKVEFCLVVRASQKVSKKYPKTFVKSYNKL